MRNFRITRREFLQFVLLCLVIGGGYLLYLVLMGIPTTQVFLSR